MEFTLEQSQAEVDTLNKIHQKQVEEISQLKLKVLKWQRKHQDMKRLIASMTK